MIRFDFDERYTGEPADQGMPWFARVLIADLAFNALFVFFLGPWIVLIMLLWPDRTVEQPTVEEEDEPIVYLQPAEIPAAEVVNVGQAVVQRRLGRGRYLRGQARIALRRERMARIA